MSGIPEAYISQIRSGKRRPGLPKATALETITGIPMKAWLREGSDGDGAADS